MKTSERATIDDLRRAPDSGTAEIVHGEMVLMSPTGGRRGRAGGRIYISLDCYERERGGGVAYPDNVGFVVNLPDRESFSPDAAFHSGTEINDDFVDGAPVFAAEVRSKWDYGDAADRKIAAKIADYFTAGTLVVWDVALHSEDVVRVHRSTDPEHPAAYRRGELAEAEPALPGWRMPVDELFR